MKPLTAWRCASVAGLWLVTATHAAQPPHVGPFDFDYRVSGHGDVRPQQVFDDGAAKTYFQFKPGAAVPLILVGGGPQMLLPTAEGPYHVVPGRARDYTLVANGGTARVRHAALLSGAQPPAGHPAATPGPFADRPRSFRASDRTLSSYATPVRGDVIEWAEPDLVPPVDIAFRRNATVMSPAALKPLASALRAAGTDFEAHIHTPSAHAADRLDARVESLRRSLMKLGVPGERIRQSASSDSSPMGAKQSTHREIGRDSLRVHWRPLAPANGTDAKDRPPANDRPHAYASAQPDPSHGRPVAGQFDLLLSDGTVAVALKRWAVGAGYELHWDTPVHAPVTGEMTLDAASFPDAARRVIDGLRSSGYPLQLHAASERSLHVSRVE